MHLQVDLVILPDVHVQQVTVRDNQTLFVVFMVRLAAFGFLIVSGGVSDGRIALDDVIFELAVQGVLQDVVHHGESALIVFNLVFYVDVARVSETLHLWILQVVILLVPYNVTDVVKRLRRAFGNVLAHFKSTCDRGRDGAQ